jgi:hypothetical protein
MSGDGRDQVFGSLAPHQIVSKVGSPSIADYRISHRGWIAPGIAKRIITKRMQWNEICAKKDGTINS